MPRRLLAVTSITCGSVLYTLDGSIANVALPVIADALGIDQSTAVLLVSTYNLVLAMVLLPLAAAGERIGHRRVFVLGLVLYVVASAGCVMATSFVLAVIAASKASISRLPSSRTSTHLSTAPLRSRRKCQGTILA